MLSHFIVLQDSLLVTAYHRKYWTRVEVTSTLDYYVTGLITTVKSFYSADPRLNCYCWKAGNKTEIKVRSEFGLKTIPLFIKGLIWCLNICSKDFCSKILAKTNFVLTYFDLQNLIWFLFFIFNILFKHILVVVY